MILYIVYLLLFPIVIILVLLLSLINAKIRKNLINGIKTRFIAKQYVKKNRGDKDIIIMHAASAGEGGGDHHYAPRLDPVLIPTDRRRVPDAATRA